MPSRYDRLERRAGGDQHARTRSILARGPGDASAISAASSMRPCRLASLVPGPIGRGEDRHASRSRRSTVRRVRGFAHRGSWRGAKRAGTRARGQGGRGGRRSRSRFGDEVRGAGATRSITAARELDSPRLYGCSRPTCAVDRFRKAWKVAGVTSSAAWHTTWTRCRGAAGRGQCAALYARASVMPRTTDFLELSAIYALLKWG